MSKDSKSDSLQEDYRNRVANETKHFIGPQSFSSLPPMVNWWSEKYLAPRVLNIFGTRGVDNFYAMPIRVRAERTNVVVLALSLGSGDGEIELQIARRLIASGVRNFKILGLELSDELVSRANDSAVKLGLSSLVQFSVGDLNSLQVSQKFDCVIANQILHHIVDLEHVLSGVKAALKDDGQFLVRDMIGKNGHQAWPEVKTIVDEIWSAMPKRYKYHHVFKKSFDSFPNLDFSVKSFEGIRSQDILPLLTEGFGFSRFYAFGGIVERFVSRGFGKNYDPSNIDDRSFVTQLQLINDIAIDFGAIKPTQMIAYVAKTKVGTCVRWKERTPEFCVRRP